MVHFECKIEHRQHRRIDTVAYIFTYMHTSTYANMYNLDHIYIYIYIQHMGTGALQCSMHVICLHMYACMGVSRRQYGLMTDRSGLEILAGLVIDRCEYFCASFSFLHPGVCTAVCSRPKRQTRLKWL